MQIYAKNKYKTYYRLIICQVVKTKCFKSNENTLLQNKSHKKKIKINYYSRKTINNQLNLNWLS